MEHRRALWSSGAEAPDCVPLLGRITLADQGGRRRRLASCRPQFYHQPGACCWLLPLNRLAPLQRDGLLDPRFAGILVAIAAQVRVAAQASASRRTLSGKLSLAGESRRNSIIQRSACWAKIGQARPVRQLRQVCRVRPRALAILPSLSPSSFWMSAMSSFVISWLSLRFESRGMPRFWPRETRSQSVKFWSWAQDAGANSYSE